MYLTFLPLSIQTNHKLLLNDTKSFFFLQSSNISIKIHHTHTHIYIHASLVISNSTIRIQRPNALFR